MGGSEVALDTRVVAADGLGYGGLFVVARPTEALAPHTAYEVLDRIRVDCVSGIEPTACMDDEPHIVATFTTGAGRDDESPDFRGLEDVEQTSEWCTTGGGCCVNGDASNLRLVHAEVDDGPIGSVRYNVYVDGTLTVAYGRAGVTGGALCPGTSGIPLGSFVMTSGDIAVRAVDLAGNEDANDVFVHVTPRCGSAGPPSEPGSPPSEPEPGGSPSGAGSGGSSESGRGCSVAAAGAMRARDVACPIGLAALGLGVGVLARVRGRRRQGRVARS